MANKRTKRAVAARKRFARQRQEKEAYEAYLDSVEGPESSSTSDSSDQEEQISSSMQTPAPYARAEYMEMPAVPVLMHCEICGISLYTVEEVAIHHESKDHLMRLKPQTPEKTTPMSFGWPAEEDSVHGKELRCETDTTVESDFSGRWTLKLDQFMKAITSCVDHAHQCSEARMQLLKMRKTGLSNKFQLRCQACQTIPVIVKRKKQ